MAAVVSNPKFLYSALYTFPNDAVMDFFEREGMPYKIERGNRVFPVSDHSSDVIRTLEQSLRKLQVRICLHTKVKDLVVKENRVQGVMLTDGSRLSADSVIVATGGRSYPTTGATGDGYEMAAHCGHRLMEQHPALVPLVTEEEYIIRMQGLSLRNVRLSIRQQGKIRYESFGELLFTHFGVSGPLALSASSYLTAHFPATMEASIDLKPALSIEQLDERILREFAAHPNQHLKSVYQQLLPTKMIPVMIELLQIDERKPVNEITREERKRMVDLLKQFPFTIVGTRGYNEAIITQGGICVKDIDPSTMESKKVHNLYFVGEVLDLDALTGGYNLQIAWSTGYLAGINIRMV